MCGHLEMVGWPLNVEACMERFFGMAEVLVVGERKKKKHRVTLFFRPECHWGTGLPWWVSHHRPSALHTVASAEKKQRTIAENNRAEVPRYVSAMHGLADEKCRWRDAVKHTQVFFNLQKEVNNT